MKKSVAAEKPLSPIEVALHEIAVAEGVEGVVMVNLRSETYPATTYFTFLRFDVTGENKQLGILVKAAQQDPDLRAKFFVRQKLLNEVHFYSQCVPKIRPILDKWLNDDPPKEVPVLVPSYYGHDLKEGQEWLAIEDIGPEYLNVKNLENLDKFHLKAAILALASFHSASLVWKGNNPAEYMTVARLFTETEMLRTDDDPAKDIKTQKINAALGAATRACAVHLSGPYSVLAEKIYNSAIVECPTWVSMERAEPWSVITHGDCWAKNFLFKYDKNRKITGVALIDFKSARAASPVLDVTNFLLSSGSADCLRDLRPFLEKHKDAMTPRMVDYRQHVHLFGCYGVVAALVHHYYGVLYPNLDVEEATSKIITLEELKSASDRRSEPSVGRIRTPVQSPTRTIKDRNSDAATAATADPAAAEKASLKRVSLIMKAARDIRLV